MNPVHCLVGWAVRVASPVYMPAHKGPALDRVMTCMYLVTLAVRTGLHSACFRHNTAMSSTAIVWCISGYLRGTLMQLCIPVAAIQCNVTAHHTQHKHSVRDNISHSND